MRLRAKKGGVCTGACEREESDFVLAYAYSVVWVEGSDLELGMFTFTGDDGRQAREPPQHQSQLSPPLNLFGIFLQGFIRVYMPVTDRRNQI